jgi:murein L,D-transpeptidase YafK
VNGVLAKYGARVNAEFLPICERVGIAYPPRRTQILVLKQERILELWGANLRGPFRRLAAFPILAASGQLGPKRREGDLQVPEGFYRITHLNPLSRFHLSMGLNYPNHEDILHAAVVRDKLGGEIFIHGNRVSIGCIAIGDPAIEKLFCLTALSRSREKNVIIAPVDFRKNRGFRLPNSEIWVRNLYHRIEAALQLFTEARLPNGA